MSRASHIYTVWKAGEPIAGFTVKHEAITWARKSGNDKHEVFLWRAPDGQGWALRMVPVEWPDGDWA
jgi:hypothetical protein